MVSRERYRCDIALTDRSLGARRRVNRITHVIGDDIRTAARSCRGSWRNCHRFKIYFVAKRSAAGGIERLDDIIVVNHRRVSCFVGKAGFTRRCADRGCAFATGPSASEDFVSSDIRAAIVRSFPGQVRSSDITSSGQARWLRKQRCRRIGGCVVCRKQSLAASLTRHAHVSDEVIWTGACNTSGADTTVTVTVKNPAFVVDRNFVEVEQIALQVAAATLPDTGLALHRVVRSSVHGRPRFAAVISGSNEDVPTARIAESLVIAGDIRA